MRLRAAAIILLLIPVGLGQGEPVLGELSASRIDASGDVSMAGQLAALVVDPDLQAGGSPSIVLTSRSIEYAADLVRYEASTPIVAGETERDTVEASFHNGSIVTTDSRPGHFLYILPVPGATANLRAEMTELQLSASSEDRIVARDRIHAGRSQETRSVADSVQAAPLRQANLVVEGTFLIVAYEMDFRVDHDSGTDTVWSGAQNQPVENLPGETAALVGSRESRQAYLLVQDGQAKLAGLSDAASHLYMESVESSVDGSIALQAAIGRLSDGERFRSVDDDVLLTGQIRFTAQGCDRIEAKTFGKVDQARIGTQDVSWVTPYASNDAKSLGVFLWMAVFVAAAAGLGGVPFARRQIDERRMTAAESLYNLGCFEDVVPRARQLRRSRSFAADALAMEAESLARTGRAHEAQTLLAKPHAQRISDPAVLAYARALVDAMAGDADGARDRVRECMKIDPQMAASILSEPLLAPLAAQQAEGYT